MLLVFIGILHERGFLTFFFKPVVSFLSLRLQKSRPVFSSFNALHMHEFSFNLCGFIFDRLTKFIPGMKIGRL